MTRRADERDGSSAHDPHGIDDLNAEDVLDLYARGAISEGDVAARGVLSQRTRALTALAALAALNRMDEFEAHARSALREGLTASEVTDVLLELADSGIHPPPRAFELLRELADGLD